MDKKRQARERNNYYSRELEKFIPAYVEETGDQAWTTLKIAAWAIRKGLWEQQKENATRQLARELSRVAQKIHMKDDKNRKVRKYHAFRMGDDQPMLWADMESITREQMDESKTMRRDKLAAGSVQLHVDLGYFNEHHNPGDPLRFDPDFTKDIADKEESGDYDDSPPEEVEG